MPLDQFMIAPFSTGLETDVKPFLVPEDAFVKLQNAYIFRGRVVKRFGSVLMNGTVDADVQQLSSRLRVKVGTTDGAGAITNTAPGAIFKIGQMFSIGDEMFTVTTIGVPAAMLINGAATLATFNTTSGAVVITGADALTDLFFYSSEPVMGLITYQVETINDEPLYAFDTQFAYQYAGGAWSRLGTGIWTGTNSEFFWGSTYRGSTADTAILFVTNFNTTDQIQYWDAAAWANLNPAFNVGGDTIETARIVIPFKDRLVLLNTIENIAAADKTFVNRCRFSQNGSPLAADAWREDVPGRGGYLDAPVKEAIITAALIKDRLIVFFESSTWELVYTGNEILPFRWQQINAELGVESTFSPVLFDKVVLGVGNVGIHACNGANVERIDEKIPQAVFEIHNGNEGVNRVYGIRDYNTEMVYWTFPSSKDDPTYPTRVLVYNYKNGSWAFNDDSITCFGYYQNQSDITWISKDEAWYELGDTWNSGVNQSEFRQVIAGNQEGFVFIVSPGTGRNAPALQITNITTPANVVTIVAIDHNLTIEDYIYINHVDGTLNVNDSVYKVSTVIDKDTITIVEPSAIGTYTGAGTISRVSKLDILTKRYNFYQKQGKNLYIPKIDFYVDRTEDGEFTVDVSTSSSNRSLLEDGLVSGATLGDNSVETRAYDSIPYEATQERIWHPFYPQADGESIQLRLYFSDDQMKDTEIAWSAFELNAMSFYAKSLSRM